MFSIDLNSSQVRSLRSQEEQKVNDTVLVSSLSLINYTLFYMEVEPLTS